jgi:Fe-S-cluster containining protein
MTHHPPSDRAPGGPGSRPLDDGAGFWGPPPAFRPLSADEQSAMARIYADVESSLAEVHRRCIACGECCHFQPGGIVLFATALEVSFLVGRKPPQYVESTRDSWRCGYQDRDLCTARATRPLGCRTYFCDRQARLLGEAVYFEAQAHIRTLAEQGGLAWYGPARYCLTSWAAAGR